MNKKPLIGVSICAVVLLVLGSLSNVVGYQSEKSTTVSNFPLFSIRIQRAINQQLNIIISQYLGEGMGFENDTTPPVTTCILNPSEPDGENGWYVSNVTVTLNASDNDSGVNITRYRVDNAPWKNYTEPFILSKDGKDIVIEYFSIDEVGNTELVKNATLDIDQTKPWIALMCNYTWDGNFSHGFDILLTAAAIDYISGMNRVEFYRNDELQETVNGSGPDYTWVLPIPPVPLTMIGFICNKEITDGYVKFFALIVHLSVNLNFHDILDPIRAYAYDNAGAWEYATICWPTLSSFIIANFFLFENVILPNNYHGYIGRFFIIASFNNNVE